MKKKKTISRILAVLFAAVMTVGFVPQTGALVYADDAKYKHEHEWGRWTNTGDDHTRCCLINGCNAKETTVHNYYGTWTYVDGSIHKGTCNSCGAETTEAHSGGTATCESGPICEKCGQEYGSPDTVNGHNWQVKYDSTQHWKECTLCNARKGEEAVAKAKKVRNVTINAAVVSKKAIDKAVKKAGGSKEYVTSFTLGKKVKKISAKAFVGYKKATTLVVKTKKLTKKGVKASLKGSKVKTVKVNVGSKKVNKKYKAKYRKIFTKKNAGKAVTVK